MERNRGLLSEFSLYLFKAYARWKGTGEPWPKCALKCANFFPRHFWKILCFLISLYSPLSHGMWILVHHPLHWDFSIFRTQWNRTVKNCYFRNSRRPKFWFGSISAIQVQKSLVSRNFSHFLPWPELRGFASLFANRLAKLILCHIFPGIPQDFLARM